MNLNNFAVRGTSAQYDGFSAGDFGTSVNLFKGEVSFDYPLVMGLPDKNGIGIRISANYSSNTDKASQTDNLYESTGVLGLGWRFGFPAIMRADTGQILPPERETFYISGVGGGLSRLYQINRGWLIATLNGDAKTELSKPSVSPTLAESFSQQGIVVTPGSAIVASRPCHTIIDISEETELRISADGGGYNVYYNGIMFETSSFDFSRIVYFPAFEKWLVAQKDGIRKIFGGFGTNAALQYIVHYNGMVVPSKRIDGQTRAVLQWNLSKELSIWDDEVNYSYLQDTRPVGDGGLEYTKACYLSEITDSFGYRVTLRYSDKVYTADKKEYLDPRYPYANNPVTGAECYQNRYETRFLSEICTFDPAGRPIEEIEFEYNVMNLYGSSAIPGANAKRLLTSVTRRLTSGGQIPPDLFTYVTGQSSNLGALASVTTATGTQIRYSYTQKQLTHCGARSYALQKEGFTEKKIWNSMNYSAVLLYNKSSSMFRIYGWVGRFQIWTPPEQPFVQVPDATNAIVLDHCIIMYSSSEADNSTKVVCYRVNPDILGGWTVEVSETFPTARCSVTADGDWLIVNERDNGQISLYTYDLLCRKTIKSVQTLDTSHAYIAAPNGNSYALLDYDIGGIPGDKLSTLSVFALDGHRNWIKAASVKIPDVTAVFDVERKTASLSVSFSGALCCVASAYGTDDRAFYYDMRVWKWGDGLTGLYCGSFTVNGGKNVWNAPPASWQPEIFGQLIVTGGTVLAFDGKEIRENTSLSTANFDITKGVALQAVGENWILQSRVTDGDRKEVLAQALFYDPDHADNFATASPVQVYYERPGQLKEYGYAPSIHRRTAVFDNRVYDLCADAPFERPLAVIDNGRSTSFVNGGDFIAYSDGLGHAKSLRIINGIPVFDGTLEGGLPDIPNGSTVFTTENDASVIVYMNTGDSFNKPVSNYQVSRIMACDGFAETGKAYVYDDDSAVCDSSGRFARYYAVDVYNQYNEDSGFTRYTYYNSLAEVFPTDNAFVPYAADGQLIKTAIFDGKKNVLSQTVFDYHLKRYVAEVPGGERTLAIYGAVMDFSVSASTEGGVTSTVSTQYDAYTGETAAVVTSSHNIFGDLITVTRRSCPAASDYPVLARQNRIAEPGRTVTEWKKNDNPPQIVEAKSIEFDNFSSYKRNVLLGRKTLLWKGSGDPYGNIPADWKTQSAIRSTDRYGNIIEREIPDGILQSQLYCSDGFLSVGSATKASVTAGAILIFTFEEYENIPSEWRGFITKEASFAGTSSLKIPKNSKVPSVTRTLPKGEYAASYWSAGAAAISVDGKNVGVSATNSPKGKDSAYNLIRFTVSADSDVQFGFYNTSGTDAFVDAFSVSLFGNPPVINIYRDYLLDTSISSYREFTRNIRDRRNNIVGTINEKSEASLTLPFYRRLSEFHGESSEYNYEIMMKFMKYSQYEPVSASNRTIALPDPAENETSAVYVDVRGTGKPAVTLGDASISYSDGIWTLSAGGATKQAAGKTADGEWLLLVGKRLVFFFNGENVFNADSTVTGASLALSLSGNASFTKLLYGTGVSFGVRYLDSAGRIRQGHMFSQDSVTVTQNFYDEENRVIAQTKPVVLKGIPFGYIADFALLNRATGIMTGRVANAYPEDEGFPYAGQTFENTPFGRQTESGLPGKAYAINPTVPLAQRQTVRLSYAPVNIHGLSLPNGRYHYMVTTSPEGKRSVSLINSQKQQVAVAALGINTSIISASNTEYDGVARVETDYLPAYFGGDATAVRVKRYDFRGNLISKTDPNSEGATRYCYNSVDEQRFLQTPQLAADGRFVYQKYDGLHRVIEEGLCSDTWESAVQSADNPTYPVANAVKLRAYEYGDDINNIGSLTNLITARTFGENGAPGPAERFTYDVSGRKKSKTVDIPGISQSFTEGCEYDNDGNIVSTISAAGNRMTYDYDSAGRMTSEKCSSKNASSSTFSYCANDMIKSAETDGGTTEYSYTPTGWISHIKSPLMEETIQYSGTKISEFTVKLNAGSPSVPSSIRYAVTYDEFGRLSSALCYNGNTLMEDISIQSLTYDLNGNIKNSKIGGRLRGYMYKTNCDRLIGVDSNDGFTYNADGAVTSSKSAGIDSIGYSNGKPVSFKTKAGDFDVTYDTSGNRLSKTTSDGNKTVFLYNAQNRVSEEITLPGGDVKQYLYGQFGLRTIIDKDGVKDVYTDHLGSPRVIGNKGQTVAAAHYTPLGKSIPVTGRMAFGFNGYGSDSETGLYYSSYRLYDPEIGRFYSLDPKPGGESPYVFCGNDPINRVDPEGDSWWGVLLGIVVGIIGVAATVATAGACLPATLASETLLVAETVVGAVAGAVGSVAGSLVTAACDHEPITGKMVIGALVSGAIGGLGSLAGPLGQLSMRAMMNVGASIGKITAVGIATGCTVGAAAGIGGSLAYSAISGTPVSGVSIAIAGLAGMGTGLLATRAIYGLMSIGGIKMLPVMIDSTEKDLIRNGTQALNRYVNINGSRTNVRAMFRESFRNDRFFSFIDDGTFDKVGTNMLVEGQNPFLVSNGAGGFIDGSQNAAVVTCHGFGRHCFVIANHHGANIWRPIKGSTFASYFSKNDNYKAVGNASYVKLLICFSGSRPGFSSTAQKFASALNKTTYGTRGVAYPEELNKQFLQFV